MAIDLEVDSGCPEAIPCSPSHDLVCQPLGEPSAWRISAQVASHKDLLLSWAAERVGIRPQVWTYAGHFCWW
ncbi:hypothetical protein IV102_29395 [bacterium]|nr:hypothetical protein [bacterium]